MTARILLSATALTALTALLPACSSPSSPDETDAGVDATDASTEPFDSSNDHPDASGSMFTGLWAHPYGTAQTDFIFALVVGSDRSVVALGSIGGTSTTNDRVMKLDADGNELWNRALPSAALAIDAANDLYVTGPLVGTLDIDGHTVTAPTAAPATFLAKLDGDTGAGQWAVVLADRYLDQWQYLAVSPDGSTIAVVGTLGSTANLGGGTLTTSGSSDVVVAEFDGAGVHKWSRRDGGPNFELPHAIALAANGDVIVSGEYGSESNLGGGVLPPHGARDAYLAKYRAADGAHQWSFGYGGPDNRDFIMSLAIDGNALYAAGSFGGTASFGGAPRTAVGEQDALLARFDVTTGANVWTNSFGSNVADGLFGVAAVGDQVAYAGLFGFAAQIGSTLVVSNGSTDIVAGRADAATGTFGPAASAGSTGVDFVQAFGARGPDLWLGGYYSGPAFTLFGTPVPSAVAQDAYVGRTQL